ncbi:MAG: hypothetical protein OXG47_10010 [bacterium]|nr:hypothetical protein [bacterium]MCY3924090.1 hypothetical protein [bacterium]
MPAADPPEGSVGGFAHASERAFSELLDFYGVAWEYEPTTFVLESDPQGRVLEAFTPDFYLPIYDVYVELTTLKQKLVTPKNRKIRKLRTRYPEIRVKLLHRRATLGLLAKYAQEALPA